MEASRRTFARATEGDIEILLSLMREFYAGEGIAYEETTARRAVSQLIQDAALGSIWLIREEAGIVGYFALTKGFILEFGGRHMVLDELYVRPGIEAKATARPHFRRLRKSVPLKESARCDWK
jgi:hypothetical protein